MLLRSIYLRYNFHEVVLTSVLIRFSGGLNTDQVFYGNTTATDYFKILLQDQTTALIGSRYDDNSILFLPLNNFLDKKKTLFF